MKTISGWLRRRLERRYFDHCGYSSGQEFLERLVASVAPGDLLLDLGCGRGELRQELPSSVHYVGLDRYLGQQENEYIGWDMRPSLLGDIHRLPIASGSVKTVVLLQVLEHSQEPTQALTEIYRVLRPGGLLFLTVPFLHEIHHAPNDFFRYTPYALRHLARKAGLDMMEIRSSGGYFRSLGHMLNEAPIVVGGGTVVGFAMRVLLAYPLWCLGWAIRKVQNLLDLQDATQTFPSGFDCILVKPND